MSTPSASPPPASESLVRVIGTFGLAAAIINITIGGGIFRLSGGILFAGTHLDAIGITTGPIDIGGTTYPPSRFPSLFGATAR